MNFIGNVEGRDVFNGAVDVIVTDGFTGNVILKVSEALAEMVENLLREEIKRTLQASVGFLLSRSAFRRFKPRLDYSEYGGAPLLGVKGCVIICHGRSRPRRSRTRSASPPSSRGRTWPRRSRPRSPSSTRAKSGWPRPRGRPRRMIRAKILGTGAAVPRKILRTRTSRRSSRPRTSGSRRAPGSASATSSPTARTSRDLCTKAAEQRVEARARQARRPRHDPRRHDLGRHAVSGDRPASSSATSARPGRRRPTSPRPASGSSTAFTSPTGSSSRARPHNVLVIGGEILSRIVDWTDRDTCVLFGDGAGAVRPPGDDGRPRNPRQRHEVQRQYQRLHLHAGRRLRTVPPTIRSRSRSGCPTSR